MSEQISNSDMEELSNGKLENLGDAWNEEEDDDETKDVGPPESVENANSYLLDDTLLGVEEYRKAKKPRGRVSAVSSITTCDTSPIKKSSSYTVAASPIQQLALLTGESPSKNRERDEKIRILREKKMMEQKKKEDELKDSIARSEEVRKRQEEERRRKVEEQRRREEEHRALVEERRRRLWDEEFERRQSIIKRTAEREARIDFKKPFKSGSSSPSKSRARSMGNMQRTKVEINSGSIASKSTIIHTNQKEKGFIIAAKPVTKPREKTPARVKPTVAPPPAPTSYQQQAAFERLRSRRSKTPVVLGSPLTEVKHSDDVPKPVSNSARDSLMIKSLDSGTLAKTLKKMRSSWAPAPLKEKQEKPKQTAMKAVPKKITAPPQKPTTLPEKLVEVEPVNPEEGQQVAVEQEVVTVKEDDDSKKNDSASSNPTSHASTPTPTSEGAAGGSKKLSQMEEHQKKLAENRRLARERAEQKAEEERIRLEELRIEEEEKQRREEEEARRQEEEELRMLEEAKKIEHERYLKAVEEEMVRRKQEEERQEAERKEKLEAELKAQEEAEKREREREEKMKKMAEEKEERKKKLEMIMKRVKAEEPISKIDPVTSPINEDASLSVTTNITSQPSSSNSDALKNVAESVRNEVDTSPNFKSPLLQKMLGKKLKGNVHPCPVKSIGNSESLTKSSDDVRSPEEAANDESENKASSPEISSGEMSPEQVLQSPFANPTSDAKGSGNAPSESAFQTLDGKGESADQKQKTTALVEESTVNVCKTDSDLLDDGTELSSRNDQICDNKSQVPKHHQHVDVVVEDDIECVIESDENSTFLPNSLADEIPLATVNDNNSSNNNISLAPHSNSSESSLENMFASVVTTRDAKEVHERGKSSETASDEDDSNCDSENSQELSVKPLNVSKHEEGGEELLNFDEEVCTGEGNKTLEREANQFGGWMADGSDVLSDIFTGSRLSVEGTGAGESLPKNFGITSTISD